MISTLRYQVKIVGFNIYIISAFLTILFVLLSAFGGNLVNWSYMGYEVIFPLFSSIAVGEWGKTRSDPAFDIISAQTKSLFTWATAKYVYVYGVTCLFAVVGMLLVLCIKGDSSFVEIFFAYAATSFVLTSLCELFLLESKKEHMATMACCVIWLLFLLTKDLLRYRVFQLFYLFIRFADVSNSIWLINKYLLLALGVLFWIVIYSLCQNRRITE
jgi:hypothetical protein